MSVLHRWFCSFCPWWFAWTFDNPIRRSLHDPKKILATYVHAGMTVLDIGPGRGYFSIGMARMAGPHGKVLALDIQPQMLEMTRDYARRCGVAERVQTELVQPDDLGQGPVADFALLMWMAHEIKDQNRLFQQLQGRVKPHANILIAEPLLHVTKKAFGQMLARAQSQGWAVVDQPKVAFSRAVVLSHS